jgi:D-alanyl-D-alanine carboxypeptidase/D-alanyl-D-alanine-endopeptidase (penicillin-binding protein 4)
MLDLFGGLLSLFLSNTPKVETLYPTDWSSWVSTNLVQSLLSSEPEPIAQAAIQRHLQAMKALGASTSQQGIWLQAGDQVLAEHEGKTPLSAASLTKIATTLASLTTWGPNHQFETLIGATGPIQAGVLNGDLVVQGGGDPLFVWEEAIALGNALNRAGIRRVTGNLIITGKFAMNFETDPTTAGELLKQGLDANLWSDDVTLQFANLPSGTPRPQVAINGNVQVVPLEAVQNRSVTPLIRHQSMPLVDILKAMNIYSNNSIAEMLAEALGGGGVVAEKAAGLAQVPTTEIQIVNGSGLGVENRISPRAIAAMLIATQRYLQPRQLNLADLYPVIGRDVGTLRGRNLPDGAAVKTGTLNEVSSLAGVVPTRDRGLVWFAIINLGTGNLTAFHEQQDKLIQSLHQAWGSASPVPMALNPSDRSTMNQLGAIQRNQLLAKG